MQDPLKTLLLTHEKRPDAQPEPVQGLQEYQEQHDPLNINRAREIAGLHDPIPVGILYQNPEVPCYEELRNAGQQRSTRYIKSGSRSRVRQVHDLAAGRRRQGSAERLSIKYRLTRSRQFEHASRTSGAHRVSSHRPDGRRVSSPRLPAAICIPRFSPAIAISPRCATISRSCWCATTKQSVQSLSGLIDGALKAHRGGQRRRSAEQACAPDRARNSPAGGGRR